MLKKILLSTFFISNVFSAENAGITGMVMTNETIENNNFLYPQNINTIYFPNDPSEAGKLLVYLSYKKIGKHEATVEIADAKTGKYLDKCTYGITEVDKLPWVYTMTCQWGGRQGDTGLLFTIYDKLANKNEKIGELYLAPKK